MFKRRLINGFSTTQVLFYILAIVLLGGIAFFGVRHWEKSTRNLQGRTEPGDAVTFSPESREDYTIAAETRLNDMEKEIGAMKEEARALEGNSKEFFDQSVKRLLEKEKEAKQWFVRLKQAQASEWKSVANDLESSLVRLEETWKSLVKKHED